MEVKSKLLFAQVEKQLEAYDGALNGGASVAGAIDNLVSRMPVVSTASSLEGLQVFEELPSRLLFKHQESTETLLQALSKTA